MNTTKIWLIAAVVSTSVLLAVTQSRAAPPPGKGKPSSECFLVTIPPMDNDGNFTDAYLVGSMVTEESTTGTGTLVFRSDQASVALNGGGEVTAVSIDVNFMGNGNADIGDTLHWLNEHLDCDGDGSMHDLFPLSAVNADGSVSLSGTVRVTVTSEPGDTQCDTSDPNEFTQPTIALLRLDFYGNTTGGNPIPFEVMVGGVGALLKNFCVLPNRSAYPAGTANGDPATVLLGVDPATCCTATCCTTNDIPGVTFRIRQAGKKRKKSDECNWRYGDGNTSAYVYVESHQTTCP